MVIGSLVFSIILWVIGLLVVYIVISTAVKDGINKSVVGQFIEKQSEVTNDKTSFLDHDLDNEE
ncbi:hypothetical protein [Bacillus sp. 1P06AnD]|uniref:hypothetical protein n=1 Tax=Bacillus sp. 1P06AnD TaxID=3132208 RepID=UPI0039A17C78